MVFENIARGHQQTRDSVGSNPNVIPIPKILSEKQKTWEEPVIIFDKDVDNSFILGNDINGVLGVHTGTSGGGQLVLGDTNNTETLLRVSLPKDQWVNFLRDTPVNRDESTNVEGLVVDADTTGTIDTSLNKITLDKNEAIVWKIAYGDATFNTITPFFDTDAGRTNFDFGDYIDGEKFTATFPITFGGGAGVEIDFSIDGTNWEEANNKVSHSLSAASQEVYARLQSRADGQYWQTADSNGREKPILMRLS